MSNLSALIPPSLPPLPKPRCQSPSSIAAPPAPLVPTSPPPTFTPPRSFNTLTLHGPLVIKSSHSPSLHGELFFYRHIPPSLSALFPRLHWHTLHNTRLSFAIDRVPATTFSSCLVQGALSDRSLTHLLTSLTRLHRCRTAPPPASDALIYACYAAKVAARFAAHRADYLAAGLPAAHFDALLPLLRAYARGRRGRPARVIHGDPVLTNVLARVHGGIALIDMRGAQGDALTLAGDAVYDVAKVVQSLSGYDHILAAVPVDAFVEARLRRAQSVVRRYVEDSYGVDWGDVVLVVCSLFTSLIPLHEGARKKRLFASVARRLLECVLCGRTGEENVVKEVAAVLREEVCRVDSGESCCLSG